MPEVYIVVFLIAVEKIGINSAVEFSIDIHVRLSTIPYPVTHQGYAGASECQFKFIACLSCKPGLRFLFLLFPGCHQEGLPVSFKFPCTGIEYRYAVAEYQIGKRL